MAGQQGHKQNKTFLRGHVSQVEGSQEVHQPLVIGTLFQELDHL